MKSSDTAKRLLETTSRKCLEEWERGVISSLIQDISLNILNVLSYKCIDDPRKGGATKPSGDSQS